MPFTIQKQLKTLLVGYGEMGRKSHLPLLINSSHSTIVGVVRASSKEIKPTIPVFFSLERAIQELKPDLAIISTPHYFHYEQARLCLENNCHVLVEKPLTLSYSESAHLVQLAEERELLLVEGLQRRYEGFASVFRELVKEDKLGDIQLVHGLFAHRFTGKELQNWRSDPKFVGAGIIDDSALHLIDLLLYFASGKVRDFQARVLSSNDEGMPHSFTCFFDTDSGATVSACGSYLSPVNSVQEEISIFSTKGALFARRFCKEWNTDPPAVFFKSSDGKAKEDFDLLDMPSGRELPLSTLLRVLTGVAPRETLLTEARDTLETHRAIELIRKANVHDIASEPIGRTRTPANSHDVDIEGEQTM